MPGSFNKPAPGIPYFTPAQEPPAGTALQPEHGYKNIPKVFQPLQIRGMTMQNRIMLSPLDQYSSEDGSATPWHLAHLGGIIKRGPGLSWVEATAVLAEGRVTPQDAGLWKDEQIAPLKTITEFAHSQGQKIGIQLAHAGRKASTVAPWLAASESASEQDGGWPDRLQAPSAIPYNSSFPTPNAMTLGDIQTYKTAFAAAIRRALVAGFDTIEIHAAHGYLLHEFLSPAANARSDAYGGSFANRTRLLLEVVELARGIIPANMPLFVRVSGTDWLEHRQGEAGASALDAARSWTAAQTVALALRLADAGVDVLDVSSGGLHPEQRVRGGPAYQAPFARAAKRALVREGKEMLVATVGAVRDGRLANDLLEGYWRGDGATLRKEEEGLGIPPLDMVACGRMFQKNPGLVWSFAEDLGLGLQEVQFAPNQIRWGFKGRGMSRYPVTKEGAVPEGIKAKI